MGAGPCALGAHTVGTQSDEGATGTRALALLGSEQFKGEGVGSRPQEARRDWQVTASICGGPERGPAVQGAPDPSLLLLPQNPDRKRPGRDRLVQCPGRQLWTQTASLLSGLGGSFACFVVRQVVGCW